MSKSVSILASPVNSGDTILIWMSQSSIPIVNLRFFFPLSHVKGSSLLLAHIAQYGPAHSAAIITQDYNQAMRFLNEVDASAVFINASTTQ